MMRPDMVYQYPIWAVGLSLATVAVIGNAKTAAVIDDATETTRMKT